MNRKKMTTLASAGALLVIAALYLLFGGEETPAPATAPTPTAQAAAAAVLPQTAPPQVQEEPALRFEEEETRGAEAYTAEELVYWNAGTFDTKQDSLRYHFEKHGDELPADTVAAYLNAAYDTREEVLESTDAWRMTESAGANPAHKYKNEEDRRFIILDDADNTIYSFGR